MNKSVEINIMNVLYHHIETKACQQAQHIQDRLALLCKEWNQESEIGVDDDCQQYVPKHDLQDKLTNASHFSQPELRIEMKSNSDQPEENMIKPVSPEFFHIQK